MKKDKTCNKNIVYCNENFITVSYFKNIPKKNKKS